MRQRVIHRTRPNLRLSLVGLSDDFCQHMLKGTLYFIFSLFSGLLGTAFSVLIRMELSGPGVQYIADSQIYSTKNSLNRILKFKMNSIIIALEELFVILYNGISPSIYQE